MNEIFDANALYAAYRKAMRGSTWKPQTQRFEMNFLSEIAKLQKELETGTYKISPPTEFILRERGKTRAVCGESARDRTVRHALCDEVLMPALRKYLIYDNGASLPGKGISFARRRLVTHLRRYYREHGSEGYILLIDFQKYFDNVPHDRLYTEMIRHIPDEGTRRLLKTILDEFRVDVSGLTDEAFARLKTEPFDALRYRLEHTLAERTGKKWLDRGLQIGDQVSQIAAVYYPTRIDTYVKVVCGEKYYGRYMDDSYLIAPTKAHLKRRLSEIRKIAEEMGITIHPKKTRIVPLSAGFRYLQIRYRLTETGKIERHISPKRVTAMRRKLKKLAGRIPDADVRQMYESWIGAHGKLLSRAQRRNLDALYAALIPSDHKQRSEPHVHDNPV